MIRWRFVSVLAFLSCAEVTCAATLPQRVEAYGRLDGIQPGVAQCLVAAEEIVAKSLNFQQLDLRDPLQHRQPSYLGAIVEPWGKKFSDAKPRVVASVVSFNVLAKRRSKSGAWQPLSVRCGLNDSKVVAFEYGAATVVPDTADEALTTSSVQ